MSAATREALSRYNALDLEYHESGVMPEGLREAWYALPLRHRRRLLLPYLLPWRDIAGAGCDLVREVVDEVLRRPIEARR